MPSVLILAGAVAAATSPMTLEQAEAMSPAALGNRLLDRPHRPIVQKATYPESGPPPPPGMSDPIRIRLWEAARVSPTPGFCEKIRYTITLAPVASPAPAALPPPAPGGIASATSYRWNPGRGPAACEGDSSEFFSLGSEAEAGLVFAAIRGLAEARDTAQAGTAPGFGGSLDDALGREITALSAGDPDFAEGMRRSNPEALIPMKDWKSALAGYRVDRIVNYYWPGQYTPPTGSAPYRIAFNAQGPGGWLEAILLIDSGRIVRLDIKRYIPPPF